MFVTYVCRRIPTAPTPYASSLKMLIFQQLESGAEAVVGSVHYSYDYDDCTDVEITWGKGKLCYRELYIPGVKCHPFFSQALGEEEIATVYEFERQNFLQWSDRMFQVRCERTGGQPGAVSVYAYDRQAQTQRFCLEPILRIQPQAWGEALTWTARIPASYPTQLRMILATSPLTLNSQAYLNPVW